ncbi:hypothetical protein Aperf_G00000009453 [Anoplocephala perfoliata]
MTCAPIESFAELLLWKPQTTSLRPTELLNSDGVVEESGTLKRPSRTPSVIFCHDMAGGYHEYDVTDRKVPTFPTYRHVHWDLIDAFIYFSHHFVTIPPVAWIDIAHMNGVKAYGTVIIELDRVNPCPIFNEIFGINSKEIGVSYPTQFAQKLNAVRQHFCFEGWLINFENRFFDTSDRRVFQRVLHFLKCLKFLGSEVIWYDAVTGDGLLKWQNALSAENADFFRTCFDGIYLNYNWTAKLLESTQNQARSSDESMRIFVGVDCFGRNCPEVGGFNTDKALELVLSASERRPDRPLSVALFAPAWSFEKRRELDGSAVSGDPVSEAASLYKLDSLFWKKLGQLLPRIRAAESPSDFVFYRPIFPWSGRLHTNFSLGLGLYDRRNQNVLAPWSRLAEQQILPTCRVVSDEFGYGRHPDFDITISPLFTDYFSPGNSLRLEIAPLKDLRGVLNLELFLFPNLSLSVNAMLSIIVKFEEEEKPVKIFADVCAIPWHSVNSANEYPVTGRHVIGHREVKCNTTRGSLWTCLMASIGSQLHPLTNQDIVTVVRRIGLRFEDPPKSLLLGGFTLLDSHLCLL